MIARLNWFIGFYRCLIIPLSIESLLSRCYKLLNHPSVPKGATKYLKRHSHTIWDKKLKFNIMVDY